MKTGREYDGDVIRIEQLKVLAHIGVPDDERASAQKLTFNLALFPVRSLDDLNDEIGRAVNDYNTLTNAARQGARVA